jgi:hypothetical protein
MFPARACKATDFAFVLNLETLETLKPAFPNLLSLS